MNCILFNGISENDEKQITERFAEIAVLDRGDELYKCGNVGIILNGRAKIFKRNEIGDSVTMRNITLNEVFGVASVFGEWKENFSSIKAITPCTVMYFSEERLRLIFAEFPQVAMNYIIFLTDRIRYLNKKIDTFSADSAEEKLYEFLISLADDENCVSLDFGMAELARRLKIGRSSLYRSIEALENNNLIKRDKNKFKII